MKIILTANEAKSLEAYATELNDGRIIDNPWTVDKKWSKVSQITLGDGTVTIDIEPEFVTEITDELTHLSSGIIPLLEGIVRLCKSSVKRIKGTMQKFIVHEEPKEEIHEDFKQEVQEESKPE